MWDSDALQFAAADEVPGIGAPPDMPAWRSPTPRPATSALSYRDNVHAGQGHRHFDLEGSVPDFLAAGRKGRPLWGSHLGGLLWQKTSRA